MRRSSSRRSSRNKVEAEETVESTDRRNTKVLRRRSVANGETTDRVAKLVFDPPLPPLTSTPSGLTSDKNDLAKELAEDLIENIQAADNIDVKVLAWLDVNEFIAKVTADKELLKAFMIQLCKLLGKTLKLAIGPRYKKPSLPQIEMYNCSGESTMSSMSMDDCHIIGSQRKLRHTHMLLPWWACSRLAGIQRPSPHETIKAKLPSTLPVGVEPVLRSSACSPSLPRKLVRWIMR